LEAIIVSPSNYAAECAAHDGLADSAGSLAAGRFSEFGRDLRRDADGDGARDVAGDVLRSRQRGAVRAADAENGGKP
jgi:hypothetical protein